MTADWKLIDHAPRDRVILLCVAGCVLPAIGQWIETPRGGKWVARDVEDFDSMDDWAEYVSAHDFPATHWMPVPVPPALKETTTDQPQS